MEDIFNDIKPSSLNENIIDQGSERSERLNSLLLKELKARDLINHESDERIDQFLQNAQSDINFDPSYIEFFSESQKRIDKLKNRYQRLQNGEYPTDDEIIELNKRIEAATSFFSGINEALSINLNKIELQTSVLIRQIHDNLIKAYEAELLTQRDLKKKLEDLKKQKQDDV